jgi:hypothetical protein
MVFIRILLKTISSGKKCQSQFTTGGYPPISSSWRPPVSARRPEIFSELNPCGQSPYVTSSLTRRWVCLSFVKCTYRTYSMLTILHLQYIQVLSQYRRYRTDHAYLTYLML